MGDVFKSFLERITREAPRRTSGPPPSGNGASSFHLFWNVPPEPLLEVEATIEVLEPPTVDKLYFWALQVNVEHQGRPTGGAHFGLQHHPRHPGGGAVNWGGYHTGGGELEGTVSELPSALDNINTRDYRWEPHRRYRYRIARSPQRGWRGSITDLDTDVETIVRDLYITGDQMIRPMVWTESFADCDEAAAAVRWTDLRAKTVSGRWIEVADVRLNYQSHADGGCANTNTFTDGVGFVQRTTTTRLADTGTRLSHN